MKNKSYIATVTWNLWRKIEVHIRSVALDTRLHPKPAFQYAFGLSIFTDQYCSQRSPFLFVKCCCCCKGVKAMTVTTECDAEMGKHYSSIMKFSLDIFEWPGFCVLCLWPDPDKHALLFLKVVESYEDGCWGCFWITCRAGVMNALCSFFFPDSVQSPRGILYW